MELVFAYTDFAANLIAIGAAAAAVYFYFTKRSQVGSVFRLLVSQAYQLSLAEIKEKLERLNDYHAANELDREKIQIILHELLGQLRGNDPLRTQFGEVATALERLASGRTPLTEPRKRALVAEIRERLRHLNVESIDHLVGDDE